MSVTEVSGGINSDLKRLLESLNALDNDLELEGPLNPHTTEFVPARIPRPECVTLTPQPSQKSISIYVKRVVFGTKKIIDEFEVRARLEGSLCDILSNKEAYSNWISIENAHQVQKHINWNVAGHTYAETKEKLDSWKNSLFDIVIRRLVTIYLYVRRPNANIK